MLALGDFLEVNCHLAIGGTKVSNDIKEISERAQHVIVGTPGRVFDLLERGVIS